MTQSTPAGWYDDGSGRQRWWDGSMWTDHWAPTAPPAPASVAPTRTANRMPVSYTRQQQGHSILAFICLDWITLYIRTIYYSVSPNHYWHA